MHRSYFIFYCQNLYIFLDGALGICFSQQFFKSPAKGRHVSDPKNVSVNVTGGSIVKEFLHVFTFPSLLEFATLFITFSPSGNASLLFLALHP